MTGASSHNGDAGPSLYGLAPGRLVFSGHQEPVNGLFNLRVARGRTAAGRYFLLQRLKPFSKSSQAVSAPGEVRKGAV